MDEVCMEGGQHATIVRHASSKWRPVSAALWNQGAVLNDESMHPLI